MAIAHAKNSGQDALELPPLRMLFFEERAASFFEMAVDHILGFDLITERERTLVSVFYVDDVELREDLLESARRWAAMRFRLRDNDDPVSYGTLLTSHATCGFPICEPTSSSSLSKR